LKELHERITFTSSRKSKRKRIISNINLKQNNNADKDVQLDDSVLNSLNDISKNSEKKIEIPIIEDSVDLEVEHKIVKKFTFFKFRISCQK
jgi:hypothetical protein